MVAHLQQGPRVRQQSLDLLSLLSVAAAHDSRPEFVLLTEDDADACPGAFDALAAAVDFLATYHPRCASHAAGPRPSTDCHWQQSGGQPR